MNEYKPNLNDYRAKKQQNSCILKVLKIQLFRLDI